MKTFRQVALLSFLLGIVVASPPIRPKALTVYELVLETTSDEELNNQVLEISDSVLGVYEGDLPTVQVYALASDTTPGDVSLHTYPIGIVDHGLGLNGTIGDGLADLADFVNPGQTEASITHWNTFKIEGGLVTQDLAGQWLAFPAAGGWSIKWYDGTSIITQDYIVVNISARKS
ncbi:hypothetical protein BX600DRAFT_433118 [Xylariales sp. PMI_506]|nr:hypothetical protein BX600DRAFT_433118 [Xylariales sp. PMI_506]